MTDIGEKLQRINYYANILFACDINRDSKITESEMKKCEGKQPEFYKYENIKQFEDSVGICAIPRPQSCFGQQNNTRLNWNKIAGTEGVLTAKELWKKLKSENFRDSYFCVGSDYRGASDFVTHNGLTLRKIDPAVLTESVLLSLGNIFNLCQTLAAEILKGTQFKKEASSISSMLMEGFSDYLVALSQNVPQIDFQAEVKKAEGLLGVDRRILWYSLMEIMGIPKLNMLFETYAATKVPKGKKKVLLYDTSSNTFKVDVVDLKKEFLEPVPILKRDYGESRDEVFEGNVESFCPWIRTLGRARLVWAGFRAMQESKWNNEVSVAGGMNNKPLHQIVPIELLLAFVYAEADTTMSAEPDNEKFEARCAGVEAMIGIAGNQAYADRVSPAHCRGSAQIASDTFNDANGRHPKMIGGLDYQTVYKDLFLSVKVALVILDTKIRYIDSKLFENGHKDNRVSIRLLQGYPDDIAMAALAMAYNGSCGASANFLETNYCKQGYELYVKAIIMVTKYLRRKL